VIFGPGGIVEGLKPGSIVADMSTISPLATREFARRLADKGAEMLDAPVSGGQVGAENATLSIMVGGAAGTFETVKPFFDRMGSRVIHIGGHGDGQTCKAANQIVVAVMIEAISEALLFASKAGADPVKVREALLGGFAQSKILDLHGQRIIQRNFKPGFKVSLQQKDLNIVLQTARAIGLSLPGTAIAQEMLNSVTAMEGGANLDHSSLVLALEKLANHQVSGT
jgi:2-hydroxy-3-oxopropionate reductase